MFIESKKKMRELGIFKNNTKLSTDHQSNGVLMLHQDDMLMYNSWFILENHGVDEILYRGTSDKIPTNLPNIKNGLDKLGNPKNVIITFSQKDTY